MTQRRWVYLVLVLTSAQGLLAATAPVTVSPGQAKAMVPVESRCPTFSWGAVEDANKYDLVIYRIGEEGDEARPVLEQRFAGSVSSWTPSLDRCLERGGRYAWTVRALGNKKYSAWSRPRLFQVAAGATQDEFREALAVVREYLAAEGGGEAGVDTETGDREGDRESDPEASSSPAPAAVGATELTVDGGVVATSFTGDGSTLTNLAPANLSAGTAGIDISGAAATAGNADTLDGLDSTAFSTGPHTTPSAAANAYTVGSITVSTGDTVPTQTVSVTVPANGHLVADASWQWGLNSQDGSDCTVTLDSTAFSNDFSNGGRNSGTDANGVAEQAGSATALFAVTPGSHTVRLICVADLGDFVSVRKRSLTVLFVPELL